MIRRLLCETGLLLVTILLFLSAHREASGQVIYVGPGLEITNIKYGIAQANDGDTIIVKDGTYVQDISVYKSVVLMAENRHMAIIGDGSDTRTRIRIDREKTDGVVIEGFKFASGNFPGIWVGGSSTDQSPSNCTIRNNLIEGRKDGIVVMKTAQSTVLEGNVIRDCTGAGIRQHGYGNNLISGNTVENCQGPGIHLFMDDDPVAEGPVTIKNSVIRNNGMAGVSIEMPHINLEGNLIEGNLEGIVTNSNQPGIVIRDSNRIVGNMDVGISIESGTDAKIADNTIAGNGADGIITHGNPVITGNRVEENGGCGIRIRSGDAYLEANEIRGNDFHGIEIEGDVENARVYNSHISGNSGEGICAGMGAKIQGNILKENHGHGIYVADGCLGLEVFNDTLINNLGNEIFVTDNSSAHIRYCLLEEDSTRMEDRSGMSGIAVEGSALIERNTIRNIIEFGIHLTDVSDIPDTIKLNHIERCGRGVFLQRPARIQDNKIIECWEQGIWIEQPAHDVNIYRNEITGNWHGIKYLWDVPGINITRNLIHSNAAGIIASGEAVLRSNKITSNDSSGIIIQAAGNDIGTLAEGDSGLNTIADNGKWNIFSRIREDVVAYYNWWGLTTEDSIDATIRDDDEEPEAGKVLFKPFLGENIVGIAYRKPWVVPGEKAIGMSAVEVFPNPADGDFRISFTLAESGYVEGKILDLAGRIISTLPGEGERPPGKHRMTWDGCVEQGMRAPPGVYFILLRTGNSVQGQKVILK